MGGLKGILDFIKNEKFKKTADYETKLNKLLDKAKKAKPGKTRFEVRAECKMLKFTSVGKKATPVNELDICRIKNLKKTSLSEKAIAFTYPGPDGKHPLMLYAMRFEKEADYKCFVEKMENTPCEVCKEITEEIVAMHYINRLHRIVELILSDLRMYGFTKFTGLKEAQVWTVTVVHLALACLAAVETLRAVQVMILRSSFTVHTAPTLISTICLSN
ncbi:hypothetical protein ACTXT7_010167 [Hymenolepis weldensis]